MKFFRFGKILICVGSIIGSCKVFIKLKEVKLRYMVFVFILCGYFVCKRI